MRVKTKYRGGRGMNNGKTACRKKLNEFVRRLVRIKKLTPRAQRDAMFTMGNY